MRLAENDQRKPQWSRCLVGGSGERRQAVSGHVAVPVPNVSPDDNLLQMAEAIFDVDWGEIPVVRWDAPGQPIGVVTRWTLLAAFGRKLLERDLLYTRFVSFEGQRESADYLALPRTYRVEVIAPPPSAVGHPVDVPDLRS
jgi:hypothetical protein